MNKRCTGSSCRRTFSTLNFDGICPYCGKRYPQLKCTRKSGAPVLNNGDIIEMRVAGKGKGFRLRADLTAVRLFALLGEKIKAIKTLRQEILSRGFAISLKDAKEFCERIIDGKKPFTNWVLIDIQREDGMKVIALAKTLPRR